MRTTHNTASIWAKLLLLMVCALTIGGVANLPRTVSEQRCPSTTLGHAEPFDNTIQSDLTSILQSHMVRTDAKSGDVAMLDVNNGQMIAGGSIGSLDTECSDQPVSLMRPWEPGSVIKPLLLATVINEKKGTPKTTYYEPGFTIVGERLIQNATYHPPQTMSFEDVLTYSLNTGAVHLLEQLGDNSIDIAARTTWHRYLTDHYRFNGSDQETPGIKGYIPSPTEGPAREEKYAQTAFGINMTITPLRLMAAYSSLCNGGIYHSPSLVPTRAKGERNLSEETSKTMLSVLERTLTANNPSAHRDGYITAGKSGTAPVLGRDGMYTANIDYGTYVGCIGKDTPRFVLLVRLEQPISEGYASLQAAKTWADISNHLIDGGYIQ